MTTLTRLLDLAALPAAEIPGGITKGPEKVRMTDQENVDELFRMAGRCLGQWSTIEYAIADLFVSLHDQRPSQDNHLRAVFEVVHSFDVRLAMLTVSAKLAMPEDQGFQKSCQKLVDKIRDAARKRKQVAHFCLVKTTIRKTTTIALHPFYSPSGSYNKTNKSGLCIKQLKELREAFVVLNDRTIFLSWYVQLKLGIAAPHVPRLTDPDRPLNAQPSLTPEELAAVPSYHA